MSTSKPMREMSVEEMLQQYNLVVPEIQREYVWGFNQYGVFESFLEDLKEGRRSEGDLTDDVISLKQAISNPTIDEVTRKSLLTLLEKVSKSAPSLNIGFLYSYKPSYYIGNDREEDIYLIDGQQRFTTLVLLLFYFALKENRKTDFLRLFKFDYAVEKIAFDYRVRSITHQFFMELISSSNSVEDLLCVAGKQWFLEKFKNDVTVRSVVGKSNNTGVFEFIHKHFSDDPDTYFDFVSRGIKFWHFKTEETSQGEELYITMNSRGQQLADNETIRAKLFDNDEVKKDPLKWSEQWEIWQDFFWKHRNKEKKGITADEGFNEFLRWVQILEMWDRLFKGKTTTVDSIRPFEKVLQWEKGSKLEVEYLSLSNIEISFKALHFLYERFAVNQDKYKQIYKRSHINNLLPVDWISTTGTPLSLINLFQLLPLLQYCKRCFENNVEIEDFNLYRIIRTIRTLSNDKTIGKAVRNQVANILYFSNALQPNRDITEIREQKEISKTILNEELVTKLELFATTKERERLEDLIWYAEDIRYNNGEILHLIRCLESIQSDIEGFNVHNFEKVVAVFDEFMKNEVLVTGNILHTDCYYETSDRISYHSQWYKNNGFLKLIRERIMSPQQSIQDFLIAQQKSFIRQYSSPDEVYKESDSKRQLFIYYILTSNNIAASFLNWEWDNCYQFGKLNSGGSNFILFESGYVFQLFKNNFTINENRILKIHQLPFNDALRQLILWTNS